MMNENLMASGSTSIKEIGRNIQQLSRENKKFDRYLKNIGLSSDTEQFRDNVRSEIHETTSLVKQLISSIQELKVQDSISSSIKFQRLEQNFLTEYNKLTNSTKSIKYKFETTQPHKTQQRRKSSNPFVSQKGGYDLSNIHMKQVDGVEYENHPSMPPEEDEPQMAQSQAFIPQFDGHLNELEDREEAIYQMVDDLSELNSMYKDLHGLVNEQGQNIEVLASNVESAKDDVLSGVQHLDRAASHQRGYRKKMCIMLMIVLAMAAVLTIAIFYTTGGGNKH